MQRRSARAKSTARKPLADISNGGKPSEASKKPVDDGGDDGALDRLLLARSDLANLFNQIDELVAQALQLKMLSKTGSQDIESFRHVLSDMHSTLTPWVSRLQQSFSTSLASEEQSAPSIDTNSFSGANEGGNGVHSNTSESDSDLVVSPSPLVSWRAGACTVRSGRQLFLLTPLPKQKILSSKCRGPSKSMVGILSDKSTHNTLGVPPLSISRNPICESSQNDDDKVSGDNDIEEVSMGLTLRHQELLGLQPAPNFWKKEFDGSLDWFLSPPKTCILMEPSEHKLLPTPATGAVLATPMLNGFESTARRGRRAGESTLKRELWVKFDAASTSGMCFDTSAFQKTERKGFLDMLEEASCESKVSESRVSR